MNPHYAPPDMGHHTQMTTYPYNEVNQNNSSFMESAQHQQHTNNQPGGILYQHQVQQLDFGQPIAREVSTRTAPVLKNPYDTDSVVSPIDRSGTPTNPNMQQSYFAHSHAESAHDGVSGAEPMFGQAAGNPPVLDPSGVIAQPDYTAGGVLPEAGLSVRNAGGLENGGHSYTGPYQT